MIKILVVDDEKEVAQVLSAIMQEEGFRVSVAYDGQEALKKVKQEKPDLIVLDVMLPKIDGFKLYRLIRFDDKYKKIPILMLTARAKDLARLKEIGIPEDCYLEKPFQYEQLVDKIYELVGKKRSKLPSELPSPESER